MCKRKYTKKELTLMNNIKKSNERCYYCRCVVKESKRTVDHKIPFSRGGLTTSENLVMSCEKCNNEKDFFTEEEYREYKEITDIKISKNIAIITLTNVLKSYKKAEANVYIEKNRLKELNKEIAKIESLIKDSRFSASMGYKLCKTLQDNLIEREVVEKNVRYLEAVNKYIKGNRKLTRDKLDAVKNKIRKEYRKEYISTKRIELMESV